MSIHWTTPYHGQSLQWGRSRTTAEMTAELPEPLYPCKLQWGRSRTTAEIGKSPPSLYRYGSFNGAAVVRLRKWNPSLRRRRKVRSFNGAAVVRLRKFQSFVYIHSGNVASMGPQSYDCGNVNASSVMATTTPGFNGAAVVRLRKCR